MPVPTRAEGDALILSPSGPLVAGGSAEEFESSIQAIYKSGYRHLIADLRDVTSVDSAGIRALVRGLTSAQRLEGSFKLVAPTPGVVAVLHVAQLDSVFTIYDRLELAVTKRRNWRGSAPFAAGALVLVVLAFAGAWLLPVLSGPGQQLPGVPTSAEVERLEWWQPFVELAKLVLAAAIGVLVTAVHRRYRRERPQTQSMEQAQVLLCVSGALMMIIIGGLARAGVRHRRRGEHHPLPDAGRGPEGHHDPVPADGPGHGGRARRLRRGGPRHGCSCASASSPLNRVGVRKRRAP